MASKTSMVAATPDLLFLSAGLIVIGGKKRMPGETMQVRGWGGPLVIVVASLWAAALPPRPAGAEGAIALGQTDSISADGLAFGTHYNDFDPNRGAGLSVAECTLSQAPEPAHKACKIIGTFHDRCFALAQDAPTGKQSALKRSARAPPRDWRRTDCSLRARSAAGAGIAPA